jgi:uncharacterized membrane protein YqaE (UPF0057 family)
MSLLDILLCIVLPPVAVYRRKGAGKDLIISLLVTLLLFWIGGIVHAFWVHSQRD